MTTLPDRFLALLRPAADTAGHRADCRCRACNPRDPIEDADYAAYVMRVLRAWEARVIDNPEMLTAHLAIQARAAETINVAIAVNADRYAVDPRSAMSMGECARILGISKPSASERRARGVAIMGDRIDRAGAARFAEARREREQLAAAAAAAVDDLSAYRARRAS